jgi:hypothetical protein
MFRDDGAIATGAGSTEALVFGDGVTDLREIKDLMAILGLHIENELATAGAAGIREMALDLIDLELRHHFSGMADMAGLGSPFLVRRLSVMFSFGFAREAILTWRDG